MEILRLIIRVLVFVGLVIWLMEALNDLRVETRSNFDPPATTVGLHGISQDNKPEHKEYILEFIDAMRPIMLRVIESLRMMRQLDSGELRFAGPEDLIKWYNLSRIARDKASDDLKRLGEFEDDKLGEHATAKQLLMEILSAEIVLWFMYDEYLRVKFKIKNAVLIKKIEQKLSCELLNFSYKCNSLRHLYEAVLRKAEPRRRNASGILRRGAKITSRDITYRWHVTGPQIEPRS